MREIKVGIAYEGGNDCDVILIWINKLLSEKGLALNPNVVKTSPGSGLLGYIIPYAKKFDREQVDIAIFSTDQDKDQESRRQKIKNKLEQKAPTFLPKTIIAVPKPHIEKWLLIQEDIIKSILKLDANKPLAHKSESPKTCLISLYNDSETYTKSQQQLKLDIAEKMNIEQCARIDSEFGHFIQDAKNVINNL